MPVHSSTKIKKLSGKPNTKISGSMGSSVIKKKRKHHHHTKTPKQRTNKKHSRTCSVSSKAILWVRGISNYCLFNLETVLKARLKSTMSKLSLSFLKLPPQPVFLNKNYLIQQRSSAPLLQQPCKILYNKVQAATRSENSSPQLFTVFCKLDATPVQPNCMLMAGNVELGLRFHFRYLLMYYVVLGKTLPIFYL